MPDGDLHSPSLLEKMPEALSTFISVAFMHSFTAHLPTHQSTERFSQISELS